MSYSVELIPATSSARIPRLTIQRGIEVSSWLRQPMDSVLCRDLESIVREEYRAYKSRRAG